MWCKPFALLGKAESCGFSPDCKVLCGEGFMVRVSHLFPSILMWLFSQLHGIVGESHLVSGYLSEGIDLRVAVYSGCLWKEGESQRSPILPSS